MRKLFFIILMQVFNNNVDGQGISNIWLGGYDNAFGLPPYGGWKMDFNSGVPVVNYELRNMNLDFTCASISDTAGNLLFATNGVIIMNSLGDTMLNGSGLNPSVYSSPQWFGDGLRLEQAAIIIPLPGSDSLYYLFHMTVDSLAIPLFAKYFYYTTVDMTLDNGSGGIVTKNQVLLNGLFSPTGIAACKHANGRDWWINIHDRNASDFHFFLLTPSGVTYSHTQSFGFRDGLGTYGFSPDGSRFGGYNTVDDYEIFDFDRCNGSLSNFRHVSINDSMIWFGSGFSSNSKYLYASSLYYIYQVDASSNQPDTSLVTVEVWDGTYYGNFQADFGIPQLAPDGKIYITTGSVTPLIHEIEFPDSSGVACNVIQRNITLPSYNSATVPNHPNYFLGALTGSICDTLGVGINETTSIQLKLQPNPNKGVFQLIYPPQPEEGSLFIVDAIGKSVFESKIPPWSQLQNLNIPGLNSGVYVLKILWKSNSGMIRMFKE